MKTDYKKLNLFETSAVALTFIGVYIIGLVILCGIGISQQRAFLSALNVFDMRQEIAQSTQTLQTIFGYENDYYNRFYAAFTQVVSDQQETLVSVINYSDQFASAYNQRNTQVANVTYSRVISDALLSLGNYSDEFTTGFDQRNTPLASANYAGIVSGAFINLSPSAIDTSRPPDSGSSPNLEPPKSVILHSFAPLEWQPIKKIINNLFK